MLFETLASLLPTTEEVVTTALSNLLYLAMVSFLALGWRKLVFAWKRLRQWRVRAQRVSNGFVLTVLRPN